eukprot:TRINITY_DN5625_c0_g1_i10.p1 TRINITY_DN5625_c0_g1~~TRINITY_DN5625_c0_g1_i10.p1  ORF type:complete len:154 (+),score=11.12 TRINITY_DN5625_c0_g1_i10:60-464(+)
MSFHLLQEKAAFCGDLVLGSGTTTVSHLASYMQSLRTLLGLELTRLYPGHGPVIESAEEKLIFYIQHRERREQQIVECLRQQPTFSRDIVSILYADIPESLHEAAHKNVVIHLHKLHQDGVVSLGDDGKYYFNQ